VGVPQTMYYGTFFSDKYRGDIHALTLNASHKEMDVRGFNNNYTKYILPDTLYYNNQYNTINNHKLMNSASGRYEMKIDFTHHAQSKPLALRREHLTIKAFLLRRILMRMRH
jgi:hypothetical protein